MGFFEISGLKENRIEVNNAQNDAPMEGQCPLTPTNGAASHPNDANSSPHGTQSQPDGRAHLGSRDSPTFSLNERAHLPLKWEPPDPILVTLDRQISPNGASAARKSTHGSIFAPGEGVANQPVLATPPSVLFFAPSDSNLATLVAQNGASAEGQRPLIPTNVAQNCASAA